MAKGDDAVRRKKNKAVRKKLRSQNDSSSVSAKVAAMIATQKRRKSGRRRMCQGMCFSLPTPDDPFNDRHGKEEFKTKVTKKKTHSRKDKRVPCNGKSAAERKGALGGNISKSNQLPKENESKDLKHEQKTSVTAANNLDEECSFNKGRACSDLIKMGSLCGYQGLGCENSEHPSKFLIMCLHSIENALRYNEAYLEGKGNSLFVNSWGIEFWKCYSRGKDIMETSGHSATTEQIAWMVSSVADTIVRKENEGLTFANPFLLFLVHSQEKATKVRAVCKPLKLLGIHTVSIHPGSSLDHQIQGLKSCEPEFLVATPERLLELVSLKAIDISGVSMLVVDGLDFIASAGHTDIIESIKMSISGVPHVVVFSGRFSHASIPIVQRLLTGSICRLSLSDSITSLSSYILQSVEVCTSEEEQLVKSIQTFDQSCGKQTNNVNVLYVLRNDINCPKLVTTLKTKGCSILVGSNAPSDSVSVHHNSRKRPMVSLIHMDLIITADIGKYDVVVLPNFVPSMDKYFHILTKMARHSANGVLYTFLTKEDSELAGPLIEILDHCGQVVPKALRNLCLISDMVEE